ncbi:MAG: membrane-associated protease 1 [Candidatus Pristimantibacillus sp.]
MGFRLKVEGAETIELGLDNIQKVKYDTDTPDDSNARSTDVGATLRISGKIITATDGDSADDTVKLALWSLVPAEKADAYRKVTLEVIAADQVVRKVSFPNAFVVDYTEEFGDTEGVGTFSLYIKQKKDKTEYTKIDGGYAQNG